MLYTEDFSMRHYVRFLQIGSQIFIVHDNKISCILMMCISKFYTKLLNCMYISASKFIWNIILTCFRQWQPQFPLIFEVSKPTKRPVRRSLKFG